MPHAASNSAGSNTLQSNLKFKAALEIAGGGYIIFLAPKYTGRSSGK